MEQQKEAGKVASDSDILTPRRRQQTNSVDGDAFSSRNVTPNSQSRRRTLISSISSTSPTAPFSVASEISTAEYNSTAEKRRTVGNRLGHKSQLEQQSQIEEVVPQLEQITQLLKNCVFHKQSDSTNKSDNGNGGNAGSGVGNSGGTRQQQQQSKEERDRELRFEPPWETKIGQLQQVVRALHRHADGFLDNNGSVIVRCYPYKSATYMHLVYNLIYATLSGSHQQFGSLQAPTEIRPILLHYDDNGIPNPVQQQPVPYGIPQFAHQPSWTDFVLVRVRFASQESALCFLQTFNRTVGRVFDRRQVRAPFAHPDLTQPERVLRYRLQQICLEKNGGRHWPSMHSNSRYNNSNSYYRNLCQNGERYFHNGVQLYKEFPNGRTEPLPWVPYSELQSMHVVVASLRKYAPMFKQKETSVIIQNIEKDGDSGDDDDLQNEADTERITTIVYSIVATEAFRKQCQYLQERNKARANSATSGQNNNNDGNGNSQSNNAANAFLPVRIERIPRRQTHQPPTRNGESKETKCGKQEEKKQAPPVRQPANRNSRPPLVRIKFGSKEATMAFCQLFKEFQQKERQKKSAAAKDQGAEAAESADTDSYSDLSDMEVFCEQDTEEGPNKNNKKGGGKKHKKEKKPKIFFPNAFAHRDLTAPKLALGYALRQFCREKNNAAMGHQQQQQGSSAAAATSSSSTNTNKSNTGTGTGGSRKPTGGYYGYYTRAGRIFERSSNHP